MSSQYLAIDPGKGRRDTIGIARFSATGEVLEIGQKTFEEFVPWLEEQKDVIAVVYELYKIRANRARQHIGSKVETVQTIGAIKSFCTRHKVPCVEQDSSILSNGQKWFGIDIEQYGHDQSHQFSALVHGLYYLYLKGLVKTQLETEYAKRSESGASTGETR